MKLTARLQMVYDLVEPGLAADIGADHGYLAAALVLGGKCPRVYACDVNPQPLECARRTVLQEGLAGQVELVLSDGLKALHPAQVDTVIAAGMGGELICRIIEDAPWCRDPNKTLVLQPMTKEEKLRGYLLQSGYEVIKEQVAAEGKHLYLGIKARYNGAPCIPSPLTLCVGQIQNQADPAQRRYLQKKAAVIKRRLQGARGRNESAVASLQPLYSEICALLAIF